MKKMAAWMSGAFSKMAKNVRGLVDFGAKLGTVFQTWGAWALDLGRKIAGVVSETSNFLGRIDDLANKTGVGTNTLQELAYAAGQTGVETEALFSGIESMSRKFGEMAAGGKELSSFLLRVGGPAFLKQAKAAKTNEERLELMLVALGKIEGAEKRAAFATKVFGKSGEDLALMLNDGADAVKRLRAQAHEFGAVQGPEAVAAAAEFGDEVAKVETAWMGAKHTFGAAVMRQLLPHLKEMTSWISRNPAKIREIASELAGGVVKAVLAVKDAFAWIWERRADIADWAVGLGVTFAGIAAAMHPVLAAIAGLAMLGATAASRLPKNQTEADKNLLDASERAGTLGGAMATFENTGGLNRGGFMGLAQSFAGVGAFLSDEDQLLAEAADRRRRDNSVESQAFNDAQRVLMLAQPSSSVMPELEQSLEEPGKLEVTVSVKDDRVQVEKVESVGVDAKVKTGRRTAGSGAFR